MACDIAQIALLGLAFMPAYLTRNKVHCLVMGLLLCFVGFFVYVDYENPALSQTFLAVALRSVSLFTAVVLMFSVLLGGSTSVVIAILVLSRVLAGNELLESMMNEQ